MQQTPHAEYEIKNMQPRKVLQEKKCPLEDPISVLKYNDTDLQMIFELKKNLYYINYCVQNSISNY